MSYDKVLQAKKTIVGTKQVVKALRNAKVKEVLIAEDADLALTSIVIRTANELGIPVTFVESMKSLGKACGIEVAASTVALIH